jgi:hypothetical protein
LVFEEWEGADVVYAALFVECGDGFGSGAFSSGGVYQSDGDVRVDCSEGVADHFASLV